MYPHHLEVTEVADQLARCYAMVGSFSESAQYLKVCLPAVQERSVSHLVVVTLMSTLLKGHIIITDGCVIKDCEKD